MPDSPTSIVGRPDVDAFEPLPAARAERWGKFGRWDAEYFPSFVGVEVEEIRVGYARMRLPYRPALDQPAGAVHGGAIATLIDTVVVPAIGSAYDELPGMATLTMTVQYLSAVRGDDVVAEGWVSRRGRSVAFCEVVVRAATTGEVAATASLVYQISLSR